jgi:hypothetical protein
LPTRRSAIRPGAPGRARDAPGQPIFTGEESAYCAARVAAWATDPNRTVPNDPTDPTSPENVFETGGENCTPFLRGAFVNTLATTAGSFFDEGCTELETVSSNYIRLQVALETIGDDRVFDPPETVAELEAWLANDPNAFLRGDPQAGPDGILTRNVRVFADPSDAVHPLEQRRLTRANDVHAIRLVPPSWRAAWWPRPRFCCRRWTWTGMDGPTGGATSRSRSSPWTSSSRP